MTAVAAPPARPAGAPGAEVVVHGDGLVRLHPGPGGAVAALRGLELVVRRGEIAAVVGPSGSGKTTLLRLLAGADRPDAGTLEVLGTAIHAASGRDLARHRRDRVGLVEQHYRRAVTAHLTIRDAIAQPLALRGIGAAARTARADELLARIGLAGRAGAHRTELSGGEQQRVAIAIALAARPPLLLADEPTGELDRATAEEVLGLLAELVRQDGSTAVIVTHDELVEAVAERVVHVRDGRAVAVWTADGLERLVDRHGWLAPALRTGAGPSERAVTTAGNRSGAAAMIDRAPESGTPEPGAPDSVDRVPEPGPRAPEAGDRAPIVALDAVARRYAGEGRALGLPPTTAVLRRGGVHAIVGPSGSGKSTLLRLIAGLDRPTAGRVTTLGRDLAGLDRTGLAELRAERIGFVDQARDLVPFLRARENVELGLAIHGRSGPGVPERAAWAIDRLGLAGVAERTPDTLSAGERLRVAIARAVAPGPELLILDEPTAALDRVAAAGVATLVGELASGTMTVIVATHDAVLVDAATDVLDLGASRPADVV